MLNKSSNCFKLLQSAVLLGGLVLMASFSSVHAQVLPDFASIVKYEGDAVVNIVANESFTAAANEGPRPEELVPYESSGVGSGFIISSDGYILTNAHVIEDATVIRVMMRDRREFIATLIGTDELTDIALLKVNASALPVVRLGQSDNVQVGGWVLAIGSPFGFDQTATQGIISAVSRNLPSGSYVPFIQTDAAVNPGNSGGPLFNTDGQVIGINSQIYSSTGGYQGVSFAIPIELAMNVAQQLQTRGSVQRGWLGVGIEDVTFDLARSLGINVSGALVTSVAANGPAAKAGLRGGDIILLFNGETVSRSSHLPSMVGAVRSGTNVVTQIFRNGQRYNINVLIGGRDNDVAAATGVPITVTPDNDEVLGMILAGLDATARQQLGVSQGVLVLEIERGSVAAGSGLLPNDILLQLAGEDIDSIATLSSVSSDLPKGNPVAMLIQRNGNPKMLSLGLN